jgi:CheY-like chemotaxis protein
VPKTLLAVDDSATMRKVLEITFAGEDFRVVTADGTAGALERLSDEPAAVLIDASLDGDGYSLAKEVRSRDGRAAIVLMASRYTPYDANRGEQSGVDDFIDKPFDTQALIDKVKKAIVGREAGKGAVAAAPAHSPPPAPVAPVVPVAAAPAAPPAHVVPPFGASPRPPVVAPAAPRATFPTQRTHTLSFEGASPPAAPQPPITAPSPQPVAPISRTAPSGVPIVTGPAARPAPPPPPAPSRAPEPPVRATEPSSRAAEPSPVATAVNGQLAGKLGDLGLSPSQVEAVLSLSREVVERVVWEVVPQLAETIIKEELARLTKE